MNSTLNTPWIEYYQPNRQAKFRLFCFPYAGGSATIFRTWSLNLPNTVEVYPVQIPGRGSRLMETPFTQISPLVQALGNALLPHTNKPYAFFGHSLGALISFELARYFRRNFNTQPIHLFVSARQAPHIPDPSPMHALPEMELLQELHRLNGTPKEVLDNPEVMQLFLPLLQADLAVDETYIYTVEPPLESPITVLGGLQDPETNLNNLTAWREHTTASFSIKMFPGDHFFINTEQMLLFKTISQAIAIINKSL